MDQIVKYKLNSAAAEKRVAEWASVVDSSLTQQIALANLMAEEAFQKGHFPIVKDALQLVAQLTKQARLESMKLGLLTHRSTVEAHHKRMAAITLAALEMHIPDADTRCLIIDEIVSQGRILLSDLKDDEVQE